MSRDDNWLPRTPWWKRINAMQVIGVATAILALGSAAIWFARDAQSLVPDSGIAEGSLRVNVNTATPEQLESIPGVGESLAQLIIVQRPYRSVDELIEVSGIGPQSLESLRPFVKVDGETLAFQ